MQYIACHECDLVQSVATMQTKSKALCPRCGAVVARSLPDSVNRTLAWTISALVLYCLAVSYPFLAMRSGSIIRETGLLSGMQQLYFQGKFLLAVIVFLTCLVVPAVQMAILFAVFIPIKCNLRPTYATSLLRLLYHCRPWSMMEIYMLGILIAMVKLAKMATIIPGLAAFAFAMLVIVLTFALTSVDEHLVWAYYEESA